jgi:phosphoribosylformylglycinamidine cyclo-ligase
VRLDPGSWSRPAIFDLIQARGNVPPDEMRRTFNLGIGMVLVLPGDRVQDCIEALAATGVSAFLIGEVIPAADGPRVTFSP